VTPSHAEFTVNSSARLTHSARSYVLNTVIAIVRGSDRLVVLEGPSGARKVALFLGALLAVCFLLVAFTLPGVDIVWQALGFAFACVLLLPLARGWVTVEHRFDRAAGKLVVGASGLTRRPRWREVPMAAVTKVVDRRSDAARAIELVLEDATSLVVARTRGTDVGRLGALARELASFLGKRVELGAGAVLAERFEIDALVGQGSMSLVYRARDRATAKPVALKLVLAESHEGDRLERFARECRMLADLDHHNVVRYVAHGETAEGQGYLAMEWLEGADLCATLAEGPMTLDDGLSALRGAAAALAVVHEKGIVHRDIKPSNLFLRGGSPSDVVLLDFGVARPQDASAALTSATALLGTPFYMAPEQVSSARDVRATADVFALGCIFYECLAGHPPFEAPQLLGVLARILHDHPPDLRSLRPEVPEAWHALLDRMLAKSPDARPVDATELLRELDGLPRAQPLSKPPPPFDATELDRRSADQVLVCVLLVSRLSRRDTVAGATDPLDAVSSTLQRFGCPIEMLADGSLLATVLPRPSATDQARIAAHCALYLRDQLPGAAIAIATGRAPLGPTQQVGDAVDRAALLLATRADDDPTIRLDEVSARLLDALFVTSRKGDQIALVAERAALDETRPLLGKPTPCVGRESELLQLENLFASMVEENTPRTAVVLAPPGLGKSRLRHELLRRIGERYPECVRFVGYGDPLSAGSPYVLIGDALRRHAGIRVGDAADRGRALVSDLCRRVPAPSRQHVSEFLGELAGVPFPDDSSPPLRAARDDRRLMSEQITLSFHEFLSAECAANPVLLVLEDLQWGDALTVKLVESALSEIETGQLFVLCVGRPEVDELFPRLFEGRRALTIGLRPLARKASEELARRVLGDSAGQDTVDRVARLAAGNTLLLEELIRATAEGNTEEIPETVLAMLQARLSRLAPDARLVLRAGSILGETFWQNGVHQVVRCWGEDREIGAALESLVEMEVLSRLRTSRFPGEAAFAFRHALVCDAAFGLLAEADGRSGHRAAAEWLETKGETDAVVLARHAERGGDLARAVDHYARAAEQSLEGHDFDAALARAAKAVACGATGKALGRLRGVEAFARCAKGDWKASARLGTEALELLPRGDSGWCRVVEMLMQVLPNVNDFETYQRLADDMMTLRPEAAARPAYLRALCTQVLGYAIAGRREPGLRCISRIEELVDVETERDAMARGYSRLWRAIFGSLLSADIPAALALAGEAMRDLEEAQVTYRLALAHIIRAFALWQLGRYEDSARDARAGRSLAREVHDDYHVSLADWYLALTLSESTDPAALEEAERCARTMIQLGSAAFEGTALSMIARVSAARGNWLSALEEARRADELLTGITPYRLFASTSAIRALLALARNEEACALALEALEAYGALGGTVCSELPFLVSAAEACRAGGKQPEADAALDHALGQMELRASKVEVGSARNTFLAQQSCRRALELRALWRGAGTTAPLAEP
jgi:serine/threonine protein kinase/tetratricopeptide (TPR) repeat protein